MDNLPYWFKDNKLIFKPNFDEELDDYYGLISQYDELIFSIVENLIK